MTLLLLHMKYTRCTWHVTVSAYINDVVVSTWKYTISSLCMLRLVHDDYRSWGLYTKSTVCMLRLVHDDYICKIVHYGTVTIIFLIVTVNMEYHIIVLIARDFAFRFRSYLLNLVLLVSAINCSWLLCMSAFQGDFGVGECAVL